MKTTRFVSNFLSLVLTVSIFTISLPQFGYAQTATKTASSSSDLQSRLAKIEAKLVERQKKLGIPGVAFAIVKDDKVVYSKGLGYKNFEKKTPITADTQLAIGSATKAFTGLSVLMSQDQGKLSIDDAPKKYIPYFKINDPKINRKIRVRDLLSHSSGLNRTDLGWITGKLNTEEIIRVAGDAKPIAGLGEKFLYQNVMFLAAGEIVASVQKKPWIKFVPERIFKPLGMNNSTMTIKQMKKARDYSFGYNYNFDTKKTRKLPTREIVAIAPAGSINSSANDMSNWLRFILNGGELNGKRLVSKAGFDEWTKPQMKITPNGKVSYGFGWFVQEWKGKKVIQHGGNIDGFNSMVAAMPEEKLGFVMLTNVSASSLGNELLQIVFSGMLEDENTIPLSTQAKKEVGKYKFAQAGFDIEVMIEDGKLVAKVPGQPTYILEKVKDRKYKLSNAPSGFFITFKDTEAFLEQPQGNFTLPKAGTAKETSVATSKGTNSAKELLGVYESIERKGSKIEIKDIDGKPSLVVGNQPPYPLTKREDGNFGSPSLPPTYYVKVKKADGKLAGITMVQPEGEFGFKLLGKETRSKIAISADELITKTIDALGGETALRKIYSRVITYNIDAIHQGVKGYGKSYSMAPNKSFSTTTLTALGKKIGWMKTFFDGTNGGETYSFSRDEVFTGKRLDDVKVENDFSPFLDWKEKYEKVKIERMGKVDDEEAYIVSFKPKNASRFALHISTKSYLPLRKSTVVLSSTSSQRIPATTVLSDYRKVDGVMLPFKIVNTTQGMGDIITYVTKVKHNMKIVDSKFLKK